MNFEDFRDDKQVHHGVMITCLTPDDVNKPPRVYKHLRRSHTLVFEWHDGNVMVFKNPGKYWLQLLTDPGNTKSKAYQALMECIAQFKQEEPSVKARAKREEKRQKAFQEEYWARPESAAKA